MSGSRLPTGGERTWALKKVSGRICESLSLGHLWGDGLEVEQGGGGIYLIPEPSTAFAFDYHAYVSLLHSRKTKNFSF